jgi:hypothetical protein
MERRTRVVTAARSGGPVEFQGPYWKPYWVFKAAGVCWCRAAAALNKAFQTTLDDIQSKYPFWSRTEGRDHIFVFPTERGPAILTDANLQRIRKVRPLDMGRGWVRVGCAQKTKVPQRRRVGGRLQQLRGAGLRRVEVESEREGEREVSEGWERRESELKGFQR